MVRKGKRSVCVFIHFFFSCHISTGFDIDRVRGTTHTRASVLSLLQIVEVEPVLTYPVHIVALNILPRIPVRKGDKGASVGWMSVGVCGCVVCVCVCVVGGWVGG